MNPTDELTAVRAGIVTAQPFRQVSEGIVTFPYDPPPEQSAEEFRKTFAVEFMNTLTSQMDHAVEAAKS